MQFLSKLSPSLVLTLFTLASLQSAEFCSGQDVNHVVIDASAPFTEPLPTSFHTGTAVNPDGHTLGLNERYLTFDGKPWLPVMGEFHYTRVPQPEWEEEILKMKAAGVQIIATYVIWLHHEEVEGTFDWSGDRDFRKFVELCGKHHMYVYARIGPWAHGEARHGGFPDWLLTKGPTRQNAPVYMSYVAKYYQAVGGQLHGLLWKDGGPVIGIQVENEYSDRSKNGGAGYILALKKLAIESGLDVPLYSVTGWDNAVVPKGAVIPVFGGYPDAPWDASLKTFPPPEVYAFRFGSRVTGNMGMMGGRPANDASVSEKPDTPFITAEMGGGIEDTHHRRPVVSADDVTAMFPVMLGSGVNLYGTYMFQGGENPDGKLSTLQESQATGYPTDVPIKSYDFQAPLGEFGQERESFKKLKVINYFLNDFGGELAPMIPHAPSALPKSPADFSVPRVSVRTKGDSGFLFMNNYVREASMPARDGFQVEVKLPDSSLLIPKTPIDIPSGKYFIWPFNLNLEGVTLRYATAQLFTKLANDGSPIYFFHCTLGIRCEFSFAGEAGTTVKAIHGKVIEGGGMLNVVDLVPSLDTRISIFKNQNKVAQMVVLTEQEAEDGWKSSLQGKDRIVFTDQQYFETPTQIVLRSDQVPSFAFQVFPATDHGLHASAPLESHRDDGDILQSSAKLAAVKVSVTQTKIASAKTVPPVKVGPPISWRPQGVAEAPTDSEFADAAEWSLKVTPATLGSLSDIFLKVDYVGDVAHLSDGSHLLDDDFFNGQPWVVGLKRFIRRDETKDLQLSILPLRMDSPIYLEPDVRKDFPKEGQVDKLNSIQTIPQYQLTIDTH